MSFHPRPAMRRWLLPLLIALCCAPLSAQMTGTWSGTYAMTDARCPGTFNGSATLYATQSGSAFTAVLDIEMTLFDDCSVTRERLALPASGSLSGNSFSGTIFAPLSDQPSIPFTGTITGDTLTGVAAPPQQTITFSLARSSSAPPDATLTGTYSGSYSVNDPLTDYPCVNLPSLFYSGPLNATLFQGGAVLSGILELRDRKGTDRDQSGHCTIIDAPDERVGFMGIYTGNTISSSVFTEYEMIPLNATVSGDTITGSGTAEDSATVTFSITRTSASPAPTVLEFAADPSVVRAGDPTTLVWTVFNAAAVSIDQGIGARPAAGSASVLPSSTTTYTLTAAASSGMTVTAQTTVTVTPFVNPPVILSFTATPRTITPGACSTLAWTTANATTVSIDNGLGGRPVNGSTIVCPAVTTSYVLTATGEGGSATRSMTVTVTSGSGRRRSVRH